MPWYKFTCRHGGGHMASEEEYVWFNVVIRAARRRRVWEAWVQRSDWWNAAGEMVHARRLPVAVRTKQTEQYRKIISDAETMLARLALMGGKR